MRRYIILFCILNAIIFIACNEKQGSTDAVVPVKKAIGQINNDSIAPPVEIPFTVDAPKPLSGIISSSKPLSLGKKSGKPSVSKINTTNGLPNNYFNLLKRDNAGNLWLSQGFANGLIRYDGSNFVKYVNQNNLAYSFELWFDRKNNLWLRGYGYNRNDIEELNLIKFDGKAISPVFLQEINNKKFQQAVMDPNENFWIYYYEEDSLFRYNGKNVKLFTKKEWPGLGKIRNLIPDSSGNIWIGLIDEGRQSVISKIGKYDGQNFGIYRKADELPDDVYNIKPINDSAIWLMAGRTNPVLYQYDGKKSIKIFESNGSLSYPYFDNKANLWIRSQGSGISKFKDNQLTTYSTADGLSAERIMGIYQDDDGSTWLSSSSNLDRLDWNFLKYDSILPAKNNNPIISSINRDKNGFFWFGTWNNGFSRFDGKTITTYKPEKENKNSLNPSNEIRSLFTDSKGNTWIAIGSTGKLLKCNGQSYITYKIGNSLENYVGGLSEDSKGNIWFSSAINEDDYGLCRFDGERIVKYSKAQGLTQGYVTDMIEDNKGNYWFGTSKGLSRFDGNRFTIYTMADGLPNNYIDFITKDEFGNLWIGTDNGLSRFDGEHFHNYTTENGLSNIAFSSAQRDNVNNLFWLTTLSGLTAMKIRANHPDSVVFENYSESEGFPLKVAFAKPMIDEDGTVWVSEWSKNSLIGFDYKNIERIRRPFNIHLTSIRLNNEEVCWNNFLKNHSWKNLQDSLPLYTEMNTRFGKDLSFTELKSMADKHRGIGFDSITAFDFIPENLNLPYAANSINFEFAAIDPHFSKYTRYQYMLEGIDKNWSLLRKTNYANYSNLHEGTYTFKIKALNSYGMWSEMSYRFKLLPPWYRTWWAYALYISLFLSSVYLFVRWRISAIRHEKKILEQKVEQRTAELKTSMENLKATQNQLVQSEKMASLGELTAGIAHEIQNPLNFINNFSEVNKELIDEASVANDTGKPVEVKELLMALNQNEEKIIYHGKKADAIVKNMLLHSRGGSGTREPVDINALADECLRLSFHGMRAREKSFNAKYETSFENTIGKINIVQQEIGRVLLNLINNAFYAVSEKSKQNITGYDPMVTVSTKKINGKIEISVKDNGNGIPESIKEKIFQPFFTTKPTGHGTGLGLSLSYDIIKAHGGEIRVTNNENNDGVTFIILLPM